MSLTAHFKSTTGIVSVAAPVQSISSASATKITGSSVVIQHREVGAGLAFRFKCGGSKTGTNAAHTIALYFGSTALCTCTADVTTAVDWECEFTIVFLNTAAQYVSGRISQDTEDPDIQYDAGTTDFSAGGTLSLQATSHASDALVVGWITVERLQTNQ